MVKIGDRLPQPEPGWKRYDDTHPAIKYEGEWSRHSDSGHYGGTRSYTNSLSHKVSFSFIGSQLRIIGMMLASYSDKISLKIDDVEHVFSQYNPSQISQALSFEISDLPIEKHDVEIKLVSSGFMSIDAIDIDAEGRLLHPDEVLTPDELEVGKRIRCHYTATANKVGTFSNLGGETYKDGINDFIPPGSSATPDGDFYFIMVEDWNGKKILVADRNIQHSISWDTLNNAGIASGSGLPIKDFQIVENIIPTLRLLTGGVSGDDKDNEWDEYIVNSTLNGTIEAGSNNVWNWNGLFSWTSTTSRSGSSIRTVRGNERADGFTTGNNGGVSSNKQTNIGFRPVLEIEELDIPTPPVFEGGVDKGTIHKENVQLTGVITEPNGLKSQYRIFVNSVQIYPTSGYTPLDTAHEVDYTINNNHFNIGDNVITIDMIDEEGDQTTQVIAITVVNTIPKATLTFDTDVTHSGDVQITGIITDDDGDFISYRVLINGVAYTPWITTAQNIVEISHNLENGRLELGHNVITVEFKDDFKGGQLGKWEGSVDVINQEPVATVAVTPTNVHYEDVFISATLDDTDMDMVSYRILINGKQVFPVVGFTSPANVPVTIHNYKVLNSLLEIGKNTVEIEFKDNFKDAPPVKWVGEVIVENTAPSFTLLSETTEVGSKGDAIFSGTLTDAESDRVSYRVIVNGDVLNDWAVFRQQPLNITVTIPHHRLNFGENNVVFEFKDNFKTGSTSVYSTIVSKINNAPDLYLTVQGMTVKAIMSDPDGDLIQYKITMNGQPLFPADGFTPLEQGEIVYTRTFYSNEVAIGSNNIIEVTLRDEHGEEVESSVEFEGVYTGIMFADMEGNFYSTDLGEVLKYLDFGTVIAGQTTEAVPVRVINKNGYKIRNILLSRDNNTLPSRARVELSMTDSPFQPTNNLLYTDTLDYDEEFIFYVRLVTEIGAEPRSSSFIIYVKADPVE